MQGNKKTEFWAILNLTMELCNRPPLSQEAVIAYWNVLNGFEFETVRSALDAWVESSSKAPTPKEIKELCAPKAEFHLALQAPRSEEIDRVGLAKINKVVSETLKPKVDHKSWAKRIMANPKGCHPIAVKYAEEALFLNSKEVHEVNELLA